MAISSGNVSRAELTMRPLTDDFIARHLNRVGDRAEQPSAPISLKGGLQLFSKIDGDYFTILGLPMLRFWKN